MTKENYEKAMYYLDMVEAELNKIAKSTGHPLFSEWLASSETI